MRLWLNFLMMSALAVMVGLSLNANQQALERARREAFLAAHPTTPPAIAEALRAGQLQEGMTPDEVQAAWGPPEMILPVAGRPELELWQYPRALVRWEHGRVVGWEAVTRAGDTGADLARRTLYLLTHPQLEPRLAEVIRQGAIAPQMTPEQVWASWGEPAQALPLQDETLGKLELWLYRRGQEQVTITFQQERVLSWAELPAAP